MKKYLIVLISILFTTLALAQTGSNAFDELDGGKADSKSSNKTYKKQTSTKVAKSNPNLSNAYINKYGKVMITKTPAKFPTNLKSLDSFNKEINDKANQQSNSIHNSQANNQNNSTPSPVYVEVTSITKGAPKIANGEFKFANEAGWAITASKHYSYNVVNNAYPNYTQMPTYRESADNDAKNDAYAYCNSNKVSYKSTSSSIYTVPVIENFKQDFILKETSCCDSKKYYNIIYQSGDIVCYYYQYPE